MPIERISSFPKQDRDKILISVLQKGDAIRQLSKRIAVGFSIIRRLKNISISPSPWYIKKNSGLKEDEETEENTNMKPILPSLAAEIIVSGIERNKKKIIVGKDCWIMDKLCRINVFTAMNLINKAMKGRHGMWRPVGISYEYNLRPTFDFRQEILSQGVDIEVLSPKWSRDEIAEISKQMWNKYQ